MEPSTFDLPAGANRNPSVKLFSVKYCLRWIATVLLSLNAACTAAYSSGPNPQTKALLASGDHLIVPGERIGPLRLDGNIDDIAKLLGRSTDGGPSRWPGRGAVVRRWDAVGLWVVADKETGNVLEIGINPFGHRQWSKYATTDGIRISATESQVTSILGEPDRTVDEPGKRSLYYDRRGIDLILAEQAAIRGRVAGIHIRWPSVAHGDLLIVPGERISAIPVGGLAVEVLPTLGGGYHRGEKDGNRIFYWPHLGLSFRERGGRIISVRLGSDFPTDASQLRYATVEGFGRGTPVATVTRELGQPDRTLPEKDYFGNPMVNWIYDSRGIAFHVNADQRIQMIDVFKPIDRTGADAINNEGIALYAGGAYDKAIAAYNEAIRLNPRLADAYGNRANAWLAKHQWDKAIADSNAAIRIDPKLAAVYFTRGNAWYAKDRYDKAIADYSRTVSLDPWNAEGYNSLGYIMATCPDPRYRDGIKAEGYAKRAGELTGWKAAHVLDTLAAAYAEAGGFEEAVKWQQKAIDLAPLGQKVEFEGLLDLYKSGKPYRYEPKK